MSPDHSKDRHKAPRHTVEDGEGLWEELGRVVGPKERSKVTRKLWAAFLKRPGAKIPRRKEYEPPSDT